MNNLQLSLIRKWFNFTDVGGKIEDYREINPYWCCRLMLHRGKPMPMEWWVLNFFENRSNQKAITSIIGNFECKKFNQNIMTLGYPKSTDTDKIIKFEHVGIEIREGREEWGAEKGKLYFVIKHGKRL